MAMQVLITVTMAEVREKVPPYTYPPIEEFYEQLTDWKKSQLAKNGYTPNS